MKDEEKRQFWQLTEMYKYKNIYIYININKLKCKLKQIKMKLIKNIRKKTNKMTNF